MSESSLDGYYNFVMGLTREAAKVSQIISILLRLKITLVLIQSKGNHRFGEAAKNREYKTWRLGSGHWIRS